MPKPYRGGCLCGAVRYQIDAEPVLAGYCQCRDCQRESGGGHTCVIGFPIALVTVTGTLRFYEMISDSGRAIRRGFCPVCGSPVLGAPDEAFGLSMIRAGSLDDPGLFQPQLICYASRAQPWDVLDPALPRHAELPPDE